MSLVSISAFDRMLSRSYSRSHELVGDSSGLPSP